MPPPAPTGPRQAEAPNRTRQPQGLQPFRQAPGRRLTRQIPAAPPASHPGPWPIEGAEPPRRSAAPVAPEALEGIGEPVVPGTSEHRPGRRVPPSRLLALAAFARQRRGWAPKPDWLPAGDLVWQQRWRRRMVLRALERRNPRLLRPALPRAASRRPKFQGRWAPTAPPHRVTAAGRQIPPRPERSNRQETLLPELARTGRVPVGPASTAAAPAAGRPEAGLPAMRL